MHHKLVLLLAVLVSVTFTTLGQTSRGTVSGTINDPTGAVLAGATITLTNTETNV